MNRTFSFLVLLTFLSISIMSCKKTATGNVGTSAETDSTSSHKIVFINIDTLLLKYDLYTDKKAELEGQSKTAEKALSGKIEAFQSRLGKFQKEVSEIQQKANTIAPIELKKMEEKYAQQQQNLAKEEESLMKQRDNAALDLDKKLQETQKDLQGKIDEYLSKIAEEKGYDLVLMKGAGGSVMYGRATLDITMETIKRLNDEYAVVKAAENK
ncbi:MAG: OmpH family outer membrane protein [Saprospiraceae bacterium]